MTDASTSFRLQQGVGRAALERKVEWLRGAIIEKGYQVADL